MTPMRSSQISSSAPIHHVGTTTDCLTDRGGIVLFSRYLYSTHILSMLDERFQHLRLNPKGMLIWQLFHQILCFFCDGSSLHMTRFDELKKDAGYAAALETTTGELASSHPVKRFFHLFSFGCRWAFRWVLKRLFIWRLKITRPKVIELTVDTLSLNNDQATKREGVKPTYQHVNGFHPLQINWCGFTVDAIFQNGSRHSNHAHQAIAR